jgi:hypothetical protein
VLDVDRDEALQRPQHRTVEHRGLVLRAVGADELQAETARHRHVDLDRREQPGAAEHVLEVALDLGRVERALARLDSALEARALDGLDEQSLGALPVLGPATPGAGSSADTDSSAGRVTCPARKVTTCEMVSPNS